MERRAETLKIAVLRTMFAAIEFPEYQREPNIWSREQKQRLIDSILRGFDIASIYFYERDDGVLECIDGRQRLNAIMSFLGENLGDADNGFPIHISNEITSGDNEPPGYDGKTFAQLGSAEALDLDFLDYSLSVSILSNASKPDEFNLQFLRLNLGTMINAGEKLHAMVGGMRDLIFESPLVGLHPFFERVRIPTRRYAKEQVAAQVVLQVFSRLESGEFARARYFDLQKFVKDNTDVGEDDSRIQRIARCLDVLYECLAGLDHALRNRAIVVSLVLLAWSRDLSSEEGDRFASFVEAFVGRLHYQVQRMKNFHSDRRYDWLIEFQRHITQASVEKPALTRRHEVLDREFSNWLLRTQLTGDAEYLAEEGGLPLPIALPESVWDPPAG